MNNKHGHEIMLSRVANSLYWMARYIERAENLSRLLEVNLQLMLDFENLDDELLKEHWLPILRSAGDEEVFFKFYEVANSETVTDFMTFHPENPNSVIRCFFAARENARQVRDQISLEMFEAINEIYLFLKSKNSREIWQNGAHEFYAEIRKFSHLFQGLTNSTFSRTEGYDFMQIGKYLERADKTTRILDIKYHILLPRVSDIGGAVDAAQWQAVLRSVSAIEAYRRFYVADINPRKVVEFLIFSESFPRSILYCLQRVDLYLHLLADTDAGEYLTREERRFGKLVSDLNFLSADEVIHQGLHEFFQNVQNTLDELDDFIYKRFMYHPPTDMAAEIHLHQQELQQQQQ